MIFIGKYRELCLSDDYPTMMDSFSDKPYEGKEKIVEYLRNGKEDMLSTGPHIDFMTNGKIPFDKIGMNDGEYTWFNTLAYYVDKYNLRLPEEFEKHILNS